MQCLWLSRPQTDHVCLVNYLIKNDFEAKSKLQENHGPELDYLYKNDLLVKADTIRVKEAADFFSELTRRIHKTVDKYNGYVADGKDPEIQ